VAREGEATWHEEYLWVRTQQWAEACVQTKARRQKPRLRSVDSLGGLTSLGRVAEDAGRFGD